MFFSKRAPAMGGLRRPQPPSWESASWSNPPTPRRETSPGPTHLPVWPKNLSQTEISFSTHKVLVPPRCAPIPCVIVTHPSKSSTSFPNHLGRRGFLQHLKPFLPYLCSPSRWSRDHAGWTGRLGISLDNWNYWSRSRMSSGEKFTYLAGFDGCLRPLPKFEILVVYLCICICVIVFVYYYLCTLYLCICIWVLAFVFLCIC